MNVVLFQPPQEPTPDYIADAHKVCYDKVAFDEDVTDDVQALLQQVFDDLHIKPRGKAKKISKALVGGGQVARRHY